MQLEQNAVFVDYRYNTPEHRAACDALIPAGYTTQGTRFAIPNELHQAWFSERLRIERTTNGHYAPWLKSQGWTQDGIYWMFSGWPYSETLHSAVRWATYCIVKGSECVPSIVQPDEEAEKYNEDIEYCDGCGAALEEGRIGYCDGCIEARNGEQSEYDEEGTDEQQPE